MANDFILRRSERDVIIAVMRFCLEEYGLSSLSKVDFTDLHKIEILNSTTVDGKHKIAATVNLNPPRIQRWLNEELYSEEKFKTCYELADYMKFLSVEELEEGFYHREES